MERSLPSAWRRRRLGQVAVGGRSDGVGRGRPASATSAAPAEPSFSGPVNYPPASHLRRWWWVTSTGTATPTWPSPTRVRQRVGAARRRNGTFEPPAPLRRPTGPRALAVGDLNGDRDPDLVAVGSVFEFNNVACCWAGPGVASTVRPTSTPVRRRGRWRGRLRPRWQQRPGRRERPLSPCRCCSASATARSANRPTSQRPGPSAAVVDDFNSDGNADLAIANVGVDTVSVLLGTGDGPFSGPTGSPAGVQPRALALGTSTGTTTPTGPSRTQGQLTRKNTASVLLGGAAVPSTGHHVPHRSHTPRCGGG